MVPNRSAGAPCSYRRTRSLDKLDAEQRRAQTQAVRHAYHARWQRLADPDGVLPDSERQRRAAALIKEHAARMAYSRLRKAGMRNGHRATGW